jgi:cell filamentation protein
MTFDPFTDFATRGYLRNVAAEKDEAKVKVLEHDSFKSNVHNALYYLNKRKEITFQHVKHVHKLLFSDIYPWAGQDRSQNASHLIITKGNIEFQWAPYVGHGMEYALHRAANVELIRSKPGKILGELSFAHPFLDGNGRTILTVFSELCRRANMHIDWSQTSKVDYLTALTKEIQDPYQGHLDQYLLPFIRNSRLQIEDDIINLQGLPGLASEERYPKKYNKEELLRILSEQQKERGLSNEQLKYIHGLIEGRDKNKSTVAKENDELEP